jgi:hypothetical protein
VGVSKLVFLVVGDLRPGRAHAISNTVCRVVL